MRYALMLSLAGCGQYHYFHAPPAGARTVPCPESIALWWCTNAADPIGYSCCEGAME